MATRLKISNNFWLDEFVSPETWDNFGHNAIWFLDHRCLVIAQMVRNRFNKPVSVNTWWNKGEYKYSGYRAPECTVGAKYSQHRAGRAIDIKVSGKTAQEVYEDVVNNFDLYRHTGLTTVETITATPTWVHCDCRWTANMELLIVKP